MTEDEKQRLYEAIKRNVPDYYELLQQRLHQKRELALCCISIATNSDGDYQNEINEAYKATKVRFNYTETILLNYICLIKHKEHVIGEVDKEDEEIQKWVGVLQSCITDSEELVIEVLRKNTWKSINKYTIKQGVGRPRGTGKTNFTYNGVEYHTIRECADDYHITKQAMRKRLKKLNLI